MNILFLVFHGFDPNSGITKKIYAQVQGLRQLGHKVYLCSYGFDERGHRVRWVDDQVIADYGTGPMAALKARCDVKSILDWCLCHGISMAYIRSFHNASPLTIRLFSHLRKAGIKLAMEIPTYPYDQEYDGFPLKERALLQVDKMFRNRLAREVDAIVTFSELKSIFGQRTICISNGVDLDAIEMVEPKKEPGMKPLETVHLTAVAEVHYWHGLDRLIDGLGAYYASNHRRKVFFHIVGGVADCEMHTSRHAPGFAELMEKWKIEDKVIFHGQLFGQALTDVFRMTNLCVGSLGRHRSGVTYIKTLKNREYAVRGLPFIYSEQDSDFDGQPYVYKVPADESPIDIHALLRFLDNLTLTPAQIRATAEHLSWKNQMQKVVKELWE